jgi:hypothetical protein
MLHLNLVRLHVLSEQQHSDDLLESPAMANLEGIIQQLRQERDRLNGAITALTSLDGATSPQPKSGRSMSASARARISRAQKARWAKAKSGVKSIAPARQRRPISPAGIARIRAAAKARWAKVKAKKAA